MNPIIKTELLGHIDLSKIIAVSRVQIQPHSTGQFVGPYLTFSVDMQLRDAPIYANVNIKRDQRQFVINPEGRVPGVPVSPHDELLGTDGKWYTRSNWDDRLQCVADLNAQIEEQILKPWRDWSNCQAIAAMYAGEAPYHGPRIERVLVPEGTAPDDGPDVVKSSVETFTISPLGNGLCVKTTEWR